jgi:hypothetical protein
MGANSVMTELVFRAQERPSPALEVRVNFGVFAGRNATQAEIDNLAHELSRKLDSFAIVAEERHEFGGAREAAVRQIIIQIDPDPGGFEQRVIEIAQEWAQDAIHTRSDLGELGSEI